MGVCPWCLTKDFSINFLFFSLTCICIVYSLKAYYDLWSNPHFMDTCLIQTRHYNVQFALFLGKESPYIFPKLNLLNTGTPLTVPFFFCLHRRRMNKSFSISNCCYQKIVHQHLFMTPTPSSVFQVFT